MSKIKSSLISAFIVLISICIVVFFYVLTTSAGDGKKVIYEKESLYHHITITERSVKDYTRRCLVFSGTTPYNQSCISVQNPDRMLLEYTRMTFLGLLFNQEPENILVIGLGGGIIPKTFSKLFPEANIDIVEIDPEVVKLSRSHFMFAPSDKISITVKDGRRFVRSADKKYDVIVLDAFTGDQIPFHLMTSEFFEEIKKHALAADGILVSNVFFSDKLFPRQMATYQKCFADTYPFMGSGSGNIIVVASPKKFSFSEQALEILGRALQRKHNYIHFDLGAMAGQYSADLYQDKDVKILTDDYAPVNYLKDK